MSAVVLLLPAVLFFPQKITRTGVQGTQLKQAGRSHDNQRLVLISKKKNRCSTLVLDFFFPDALSAGGVERNDHKLFPSVASRETPRRIG